MNLKLRPRLRRLAWVAAISVVGLAVLTFAAVELTSRPSFCRTCHYMEPYYNSWKTSAHRDISCTQCHFPPGIESEVRAKFEGLAQVASYVTRTYTKRRPVAEIPDESCLRSGCHEARLLSGKVKYKIVTFDHVAHLTQMRHGKRLRCTSCHSQIVQGEHVTVTSGTCFLCHFKGDPEILGKTSRCTLCHQAPTKATNGTTVRFDHTDIVDKGIDCHQCHGHVIVGDGAVPKENCFACHAEPERTNRYGDIAFVHKTHVTEHKVECLSCHLAIQHKVVKAEDYARADCQSCHPDFHQSQEMLFTGRGGHGVPPLASPMYEAGLGCRGCHLFHSANGHKRGETFVATPASCEVCHGKGYGDLLKRWEAASEEKIVEIDRIYRSVSQDTVSLSQSTRKRVREALSDAKGNIDLVTRGKSVHNVQFADRLLAEAYSQLGQVATVTRPGTRLPSFSPSTANIPLECSACHYGQEEVDVKAFGWVFPHKKHIVDNQLKCVKCHSNMRRHGELIVAKSDCMGCHHRDPKKPCGNCHRLQAQVYSGTVDLLAAPEPSEMYQAEVDCVSCHVEGDRIVRPNASACANCHDKGYTRTLADWQRSTRDALDTAEELVRRARGSSGSERLRKAAELIRRDGSLGVHNHGLVETLLTKGGAGSGAGEQKARGTEER